MPPSYRSRRAEAGICESSHGSKFKAPRSTITILEPEYEELDDEDRKLEARQQEDRQWMQQQRWDLEAALKDQTIRAKPTDLLSLLPEVELMRWGDALRVKDLSMDDFVGIMMEIFQHHPNFQDVKEEQMLRMFQELFEMIDVNGNGGVEWEEMSQYLITAYDRSQRERIKAIKPYHHTPRQQCSVHLRRGSLSYIADLDSYVLLGMRPSPLSNRIVLYNSDKSAETEIDSNVDQVEYLCAEYIPSVKQLAVSTTSGHLHFYNMRQNVEDQYSIKAKWWSNCNHGLLKWSDRKQLLFGADTGQGNLLAYRVGRDGETQFLGSPVIKKHLHSAQITGLAFVQNSLLASCSLDRTVKMYDLHDLKEVCSFSNDYRGHQKGILSIDFSKEHNILVTAGYEYKAILWMPIAGLDQYICSLEDRDSPHRHTLRHATFVPNSHELITVDNIGITKVWDLRMMKPTQTFHMADPKCSRADYERYTVQGFAYDNQRKTMTILGRDHQHTSLFTWLSLEKSYRVDPTKAHDAAVVAAYQHQDTGTILTCDATAIKVWNQRQGHVTLSFPHISPGGSPITCLGVEDHGRRFLIGTFKGTVSSHTFGTGQRRVKFKSHSAQVLAAAFCPVKSMASIVSISSDRTIHVYPDVDNSNSVVPPRCVVQLQSAPCHCTISPQANSVLVGDNEDSVTVYQFHSDGSLVNKGRSTNVPLRTRTSNYVPSSPFAFSPFGSRQTTTLSLCSGSPIARLTSVAPSPAHSEGAGETNSLGGPKFSVLSVVHAAMKGSSLETEQALVDTDSTVQTYAKAKHQEIMALVVLLPYAAFVCADTTGLCRLWALPPSPMTKKALAAWRPLWDGRGTDPVVVTHIDYVEDASLLVCGDSNGKVTILNMTEVITQCKVEKLGHLSYLDPNRAVKKTKTRMCTPTQVASWPTHARTLVQVQYVPHKQYIITCSEEGAVGLWDLKGTRLGLLQQGRSLPVLVDQSTLTPWLVDTHIQRVQRGEAHCTTDACPTDLAVSSPTVRLGAVFRRVHMAGLQVAPDSGRSASDATEASTEMASPPVPSSIALANPPNRPSGKDPCLDISSIPMVSSLPASPALPSSKSHFAEIAETVETAQVGTAAVSVGLGMLTRKKREKMYLRVEEPEVENLWVPQERPRAGSPEWAPKVNWKEKKVDPEVWSAAQSLLEGGQGEWCSLGTRSEEVANVLSLVTASMEKMELVKSPHLRGYLYSGTTKGPSADELKHIKRMRQKKAEKEHLMKQLKKPMTLRMTKAGTEVLPRCTPPVSMLRPLIIPMERASFPMVDRYSKRILKAKDDVAQEHSTHLPPI
uniref:EF-hand domain-containing protein n=1 Tax=Eutreptiella gymnastica TaxID=73025 RepID=A0A7S1J1I3_9EUGL|mmetsp:Transcript_59644/g.106345  ORF Transcript_59644/g.106345 Transcript_59644/m.106345 type:complete len:1318 (+) Transcript_59644:173-4126(+)